MENNAPTLRDWFAAMYLSGRSARYQIDNTDDVAKFAYAMADAMLRARAQTEPLSPAEKQAEHLSEFGK